MKTYHIDLAKRHRLYALPLIAFISVTMIACRPDQSATTSSPNMDAKQTSMPQSLPKGDATKQAVAEMNRRNNAALATAAAIVTLPPRTPGPPVETPYPSPTLIMGMLPRCETASAVPYVFNNCWRGMLNSEEVNVGAGQINDGNGNSYGGIAVRIGGELTFYGNYNPPIEIYSPPAVADDVQIVAVTGTLFTIAPLNPPPNVTWIFDLANRRWINAQGTPLPTLTLAPTPFHK